MAKSNGLGQLRTLFIAQINCVALHVPLILPDEHYLRYNFKVDNKLLMMNMIVTYAYTSNFVEFGHYGYFMLCLLYIYKCIYIFFFL